MLVDATPLLPPTIHQLKGSFMSAIDTYLEHVITRIEGLGKGEPRAAIDATVQKCADTIQAGDLVYTFGTGHGSFAALEIFPRTGTCAGFRPIVETPLSNLHNIFGDSGVSQYRFLHTSEGYGQAIMASYRFKAGETMILYSQSGLNAVIIDIAIESKKLGMNVVAITSVPHSSSTPAKHSSGKRLFEAADIVIDTGVPVSDASVHIEGFPHPVGPTSTAVATSVTHAIVTGTVEELVSRDYTPLVMVNANVIGADEANAENERVLEETWRRFTER